MANHPLMYVIPESEEFMPGYAHPEDAGLDLRFNFNYTDWGVEVLDLDVEDKSIELLPRTVHKVSTGLRVEIPKGYVGFITPRSGLASRGISVNNAPGTIDAGYQGPLEVLLINHSHRPVRINHLDRIAQLVILPIVQPFIVPVSEFPEPTSRGEAGFGSTGDK